MVELARQIEELIVAIDDTQDRLAAIYRDKRAAIRQADGPTIDRLTRTEESLVADLQVHLRQRERILDQARQSGLPSDSLVAVVQTFETPFRERLLGQLEATRRMADANRRESWIVWIVCKQSLRFFSDVIELIANGGRRAPIYLARPGGVAELSPGGALLDAHA
jgi:hypothetical protein